MNGFQQLLVICFQQFSSAKCIFLSKQLAFVLVHNQFAPAFTKGARWAIWTPVNDGRTFYHCPSTAQTPPRDGWEAKRSAFGPAPTVLLSGRDRDEILEGRKIRGIHLKPCKIPMKIHTLFGSEPPEGKQNHTLPPVKTKCQP